MLVLSFDIIIYANAAGRSAITEIMPEAKPKTIIRSVITLQPVAFVYNITLHLTICIIFNYFGFWNV